MTLVLVNVDTCTGLMEHTPGTGSHHARLQLKIGTPGTSPGLCRDRWAASPLRLQLGAAVRLLSKHHLLCS
jgi:hypothetical protein